MWTQRTYRVILIFFVCLPVLPAVAQTVVEAEGTARIEPDINISRDLAVLRAKQQALEILGIGISSKNIATQGKMLDEMIMVQTSGFVERYEILEESRKNGYYSIRLRAWVKKGKALEDAYRSVFRERILSLSSNGEGSKNIERLLRRSLVGHFYYVLASDFQEIKPDYQILINSSVNVHSDFGGFKSFYAEASISMVQVAVGRQVIYVAPDEPIIVYGTDLDHAVNGRTVNQYSRKLAAPLMDCFWKELSSLEHKGSRVVRITISELPGVEAFRAFRDYVRNICLGMEGLYGESYSDGEAALQVGYREKSLYLATIIGYRSEYRVIEHDWEHVKIVYVGGSIEKGGCLTDHQ